MRQHEADHTPCCRAAEEALNRYVDGELPVEEQPALFAHLTACPQCRMLLESVLQFRRMSRLERVAVPPAADEAFLKSLAHHKARRAPVERMPRSQRFMRPMVATLCLALLFVVGMWAAGEPPSPPVTDHETERTAPEKKALEEKASTPEREALYVFYPGLTVEAQRVEEPASPDAL